MGDVAGLPPTQLRIERLEAENAELRKQPGEMRADCERAWAARDVAYDAVKKRREALNDLVEQSGGVYGLHLDGDPAPWSELLAGGRFEEWLGVFAEKLPDPADDAILAAHDARVRAALEARIKELETLYDRALGDAYYYDSARRELMYLKSAEGQADIRIAAKREVLENLRDRFREMSDRIGELGQAGHLEAGIDYVVARLHDEIVALDAETGPSHNGLATETAPER